MNEQNNEYSFINKKRAVKCKKLLWEIEQIDEELFFRAEFCLQMLLDGAKIMLKRSQKPTLKLIK